MLTAAEVVRQVGIIDALQERTYELCHLVENSKQEQFVFLPLDHGVRKFVDVAARFVYTPSKYSELEALVLNGKANFCVSGDALTKARMPEVGGVFF